MSEGNIMQGLDEFSDLHKWLVQMADYAIKDAGWGYQVGIQISVDRQRFTIRDMNSNYAIHLSSDYVQAMHDENLNEIFYRRMVAAMVKARECNITH